jgi:hypothetical protein
MIASRNVSDICIDTGRSVDLLKDSILKATSFMGF